MPDGRLPWTLVLGGTSIAAGAACVWLMGDAEQARRTLLVLGCVLVLVYPFGFRLSSKLRLLAIALLAAGTLPLLIGWQPSVFSGTGACLALGFTRSEILVRRAPKWRILVELGLLALTAFALPYFYDESPLGIVFALWTFWLIQAAHPLLVSLPTQAAGVPPTNFAQACRSAEHVLSRWGAVDPIQPSMPVADPASRDPIAYP